jgi:hypothetical protein
MAGSQVNLAEAWVVYAITAEEALRMYNVKTIVPVNIDPTIFRVPYAEHWTPESYEITVGNNPASWKVGEEWVKLQGVNDFGVVPFVVIPHIRVAGLHGKSHIDGNEGLMAEWNARVADVGDVIAAGAQFITTLSGNVTATVENIIPGVKTIRLGGGMPGADTPEMEKLDLGDLNPTSLDFLRELDKYMLRAFKLSDVVFGEDEGSQRSALTLAFRMFPLTTHISLERYSWEAAMNHVARIIVRMVLTKSDIIKAVDPDGIAAKINDSHRFHKFTVDWHPMAPRDREQMVNEQVLRSQAGLIAPETSFAAFGDIRDFEREMEKIIEWRERLSQIDAKAMADTAMDPEVDVAGPSATSELEE